MFIHGWLHLMTSYIEQHADLIIIILSDNHDGPSSFHGGNYRPYFEKDQQCYSDDSTCGIDSQKTLGVGSWEEILEQCTTGLHTVTSHGSKSSIQIASAGIPPEQQNITSTEFLAGNSTLKEEFGIPLPFQTNWQVFTSFYGSLSTVGMFLSCLSFRLIVID